MEKVICNVNTHKEICKLCCSNKQLEKELKDSLCQPKTLIEQIFQRLSLKGSNFKMFQQLTNVPADSDKNFQWNKLSLNLRSDFTKTKYPELSTQDIVSTELITFMHLSVYNLTLNGTFQVKVERLNLSWSQFLKRVQMV